MNEKVMATFVDFTAGTVRKEEIELEFEQPSSCCICGKPAEVGCHGLRGGALVHKDYCEACYQKTTAENVLGTGAEVQARTDSSVRSGSVSADEDHSHHESDGKL